MSPAKPNRLQLRRTKGWRMPAHTRKVDRTTVYGNPFNRKGDDIVQLHRAWLTGQMTAAIIEARYPPLVAKHLISRRLHVLATLSELRGMNLACWCPLNQPCHADLLLELANA
jgi:hypothetical protein